MSDFLTLTADIVSAHVEHNRVHSAEIPSLIKSVHDALAKLEEPAPEPLAEKPKPAVSARKSIATTDAIISMIDGKPYKALRRHLRTHGHTEHSYRDAFGLPHDYPMVAPAYSEQRRGLAKTIGLGRKQAAEAAASTAEGAAPIADVVKRRGRNAAARARARR